MQLRKSLLALWVVGAVLFPGCRGGDPPAGGESSGTGDPEAWEGDVAEAARFLRPRGGTAEDWAILKEKAAWAWSEGIDSLPMGESMARLGLSFVGAPYTPGTLELAGAEDLVVNLQEFDCVTLVENVLALARFIRLARPEILDSTAETSALFRSLLREIRYRGGRVDGYPSRLHYFSDWILDNEAKRIVRELTADFGGVEDHRALDFMSKHPEAYRQLSNPLSLRAIRDREIQLSARTRFRIPQERIPALGTQIQDGDILAATSTLDGLDVAHTGLAIWRGGALHLLHAPLVGEAVEVSTAPLADRILRIQGQDGIRVLRPLEPAAGGSGPGGHP